MKYYKSKQHKTLKIAETVFVFNKRVFSHNVRDKITNNMQVQQGCKASKCILI